MSEPYVPQLIYYPERDEYEFVTEDVTTVERALTPDDSAGLLLRLQEPREAIGFCISGELVRRASPLSNGRETKVSELDPKTGEVECCIACAKPFLPADLVLSDASGGLIHAACCGPERESYVGGDGEPLRDGEPIPTPWAWQPDLGKCPHCGCAVSLEPSHNAPDALYVFACPDGSPCRNSGLGTYAIASQLPQAIAAWNRRVSPLSDGDGWQAIADPVAARLYRAAKSLADNIAEFGHVTDGERIDDLDAALEALTPENEAPRVVTEKQAAYALLWRMHTADWRIHAVRAALLNEIGKDAQRGALEWALHVFGPLPAPPREVK